MLHKLSYYNDIPCVQNQTKLASSLQTAYNLGVLATLVQSLLADLSLAVEDQIRGTFDINKISKDLVSKGMLVRCIIGTLSVLDLFFRTGCHELTANYSNI
jgi:conserved oligomeric Golgi complex subunit COG5-like protein